MISGVSILKSSSTLQGPLLPKTHLLLQTACSSWVVFFGLYVLTFMTPNPTHPHGPA